MTLFTPKRSPADAKDSKSGDRPASAELDICTNARPINPEVRPTDPHPDGPGASSKVDACGSGSLDIPPELELKVLAVRIVCENFAEKVALVSSAAFSAVLVLQEQTFAPASWPVWRDACAVAPIAVAFEEACDFLTEGCARGMVADLRAVTLFPLFPSDLLIGISFVVVTAVIYAAGDFL